MWSPEAFLTTVVTTTHYFQEVYNWIIFILVAMQNKVKFQHDANGHMQSTKHKSHVGSERLKNKNNKT